MWSEQRFAPRARSIVIVVATILIGVVVLVVAAGRLAAFRLDAAREAWNETLGSWERIVERYPATGPNPSALELERLSAALGIDIVPRSIDKRTRPDAETTGRFKTLKREVFGKYMQPRIERVERGDPGAPPEALSAFLAEHDETLLALRRHLLTAPVPVWESDMSRAFAAPIPNLLGQLDLQKLLGNVALARVHAGDVHGALLDVEASFNLTRSLRESPILINQLIAIAQTRIQAGLLRQIPAVPAAWGAKLQEHDFRDSFVTSLKLQGRVWLELGRDDVWSAEPKPWWKRAGAPVTLAYDRYCLADLSSTWRERMENLERVEALCDYDLSRHDADLEIPVPGWNHIGKIMAPNLTNATDRVARLEVDLELTRLLLEADARARTDDGAVAVTGLRTSDACPQDHWVFATTDDGWTIAFERDLDWPAQMGAVLPIRARSF